MLISTLPPIHMDSLMEEMIENPLVGGVRYNIGAFSAYSARETLEKILSLTELHKKKFWLDLKGRQLRIVRWTMADLGMAVLNHDIEVELPAYVYFRGNDYSQIKVVNGNTIYVDPLPQYAVGEGQAINIRSNDLRINGYLTDEDYEYIDAACNLGVTNYMLSFVEEIEDISEVENQLAGHKLANDAELVLKIESPKGMQLVAESSLDFLCYYRLMAARDDWFINSQPKAQILLDLQKMAQKDPSAILASHLFKGLEKDGQVSMADLSDLYLMRQFGYQNFMLSDGVARRHFRKAVQAWKEFLEVFPEEEQ